MADESEPLKCQECGAVIKLNLSNLPKYKPQIGPWDAYMREHGQEEYGLTAPAPGAPLDLKQFAEKYLQSGHAGKPHLRPLADWQEAIALRLAKDWATSELARLTAELAEARKSRDTYWLQFRDTVIELEKVKAERDRVREVHSKLREWLKTGLAAAEQALGKQ